MKGYRILLFTQEDRKIGHHLASEWILSKAKELKTHGATLTIDAVGFGHSGSMHSAGLFKITDRPVTVSVTADEATCEALMAALTEARADIFFARNPVEFGRTAGGTPQDP